MKKTAGQPAKYRTPEALQAKIDEYFVWILGESHLVWDRSTQPKGAVKPPDEDLVEYDNAVRIWDRKPQPPTITGLVLYLGFVSRQSLTDYQQDRPKKFSDIIKRAKLLVENGYEHDLRGSNCTGPIFALKQMGWKDRSEVDTNNTSNVTFKFESDPTNEPLPDPEID